MPGRLTFTIELFQENTEQIPELAQRARDLRPAFDNIFLKWARDNEDKFAESEGAEAAGAAVDPEVFWKGLTPGYMKSKRRAGFGDHLMVRTGALEAALTDPERFFRLSNPADAIFGTPLAPEELAKAGYNWKRRQTIFLSVDDQRMIDKEVSDYFSFGPQYPEIMFAKGMASLANKRVRAQMDVDFGDTVQ